MDVIVNIFGPIYSFITNNIINFHLIQIHTHIYTYVYDIDIHIYI